MIFAGNDEGTVTLAAGLGAIDDATDGTEVSGTVGVVLGTCVGLKVGEIVDWDGKALGDTVGAVLGAWDSGADGISTNVGARDGDREGGEGEDAEELSICGSEDRS